MAGTIGEDFARIVALARAKLTQVEVTEELDSDRGILAIRGQFGDHRVFMKETISPRGRRYVFYILEGDRVVLGLDNHADRQALASNTDVISSSIWPS
jgi:hypothetical protein